MNVESMLASSAVAYSPARVPRAPADSRLQIVMSPYYGEPDFSPLARLGEAGRRIDRVSVADLLRNGFVYAPHSIFEGVKIVTHGFDPGHDMYGRPEFRFMFRDSGRDSVAHASDPAWLETYDGLLCQAMHKACEPMRQPWLLQSGGKDSTPLAIAAAKVRPDTQCITYLGGREEDEVESASIVARTLGLRHEALVCDPGRAYDRYIAVADRIPLLTADFALLSYIDLACEISDGGGDGVLDGMGADGYFGVVLHRRERMLGWLAREWRLPPRITELPLVQRNFNLCYLLSTLQMDPVERVYPGSRFSNDEVDALFGPGMAAASKARLGTFLAEIASADTEEERWRMASSIAGFTGSFGKGMFTAHAFDLRVAYPFCDHALRDWVYRQLPTQQRVDPVTQANKVLVRKYIEHHVGTLPYVSRKGSFRFDLCGLARQRFDQVRGYAEESRDELPGAVEWLDRNRPNLGNKYHASKFYLLAVVLPWLVKQRQTEPVPRMQIAMSPYYGDPDFSQLQQDNSHAAPVDVVSIADILRNGFVYPPNSIRSDVKVATLGFDPKADLHRAPRYRFRFPEKGKVGGAAAEGEAVATFRRLLCEAYSDASARIDAPWLLQSAGKDSTSLAIAAAEVRPDTVCITYLGGSEENEIASARHIARTLGLRHEVMLCDAGRAYDRYIRAVPRMPLLTGDFALLSYADLATEIASDGGDGIVDGLGSDVYFGIPMHSRQHLLSWLARGLRLPVGLTELPLVERSFNLCYLLSTLQMNSTERIFPGSRFTDTEVDLLLGRNVSASSRERLRLFRSEFSASSSGDDLRAMAMSIAESASAFAKGLYTADALSLRIAYPYCNGPLRDWVYRKVPPEQHIDPRTRANKALVRRMISERLGELPYVEHKGSFRFDLCGLARTRFDQVHAYAQAAADVLPGAEPWLLRNRGRLGNKYHASKFYLLAVALPWIAVHGKGQVDAHAENAA
jgi:asparagine synthetase B (glutamine-hydrolysing)